MLVTAMAFETASPARPALNSCVCESTAIAPAAPAAAPVEADKPRAEARDAAALARVEVTGAGTTVPTAVAAVAAEALTLVEAALLAANTPCIKGATSTLALACKIAKMAAS